MVSSRNEKSTKRLWQVVLFSSIAVVLAGFWNLATPLAMSSALVQAITTAPQDKVYDVAYESLAGVMDFFAYLYIFMGSLIAFCSLVALLRFRSTPKSDPTTLRTNEP